MPQAHHTIALAWRASADRPKWPEPRGWFHPQPVPVACVGHLRRADPRPSSTTLYGLPPAAPPVGSAAAPYPASTGIFSVSPFATDAARDRAQSSVSIPGTPAASPTVPHQGNLACVHAVRGWIAPAPNAMFPTSGVRLLASRGSASSTVPALPTLVSSIGLLIPSPLPRPLARAAMQPASAVVRGCYQTIVAQSGTHCRFPRRTQRQPGSFYEHRFPLFCRT